MNKTKYISIKVSFLLFCFVSFGQSGYTVAPWGENGIIIRPTAQTINKPFKGIVNGFNWLRDYSNTVVKNRFIESLIIEMKSVPVDMKPDFWRINYYTEPSGAKKMGHISKFGSGKEIQEAFIDNYKSPSITSTPPKLPFANGLFIKVQKTKDGIIISEISLNDQQIRSMYVNARKKAREDIISWSKDKATKITPISEIYPDYIEKSLLRNNRVKKLSRQIENQTQRNKLLSLNRTYAELEYEMKNSLKKYVKNQEKLHSHNNIIGVANLLLSIANISNSIYQSNQTSELEKSVNRLSEQTGLLQADVDYLKSSINNLHQRMSEINQTTVIIIESNDLSIDIDYPSNPPILD